MRMFAKRTCGGPNIIDRMAKRKPEGSTAAKFDKVEGTKECEVEGKQGSHEQLAANVNLDARPGQGLMRRVGPRQSFPDTFHTFSRAQLQPQTLLTKSSFQSRISSELEVPVSAQFAVKSIVSLVRPFPDTSM